jgi:hypothetical protein
VKEGADTPKWLATSTDVANVSGKLWASRWETPCIFRDRSAIERLWELYERMVTESRLVEEALSRNGSSVQ